MPFEEEQSPFGSVYPEGHDPNWQHDPTRKKAHGYKAYGKKTYGSMAQSITKYANQGDPEKVGISRKKRKTVNHNPRTKDLLNKMFPEGQVVYVEKTIVGANGFAFKQDYLGFMDFRVEMPDKDDVAVQATTLNAKSAHIVKLSQNANCETWLSQDKKFILLLWTDEPDTAHEWTKLKGGKYYWTVIWMSLDILTKSKLRQGKRQAKIISKNRNKRL